MKNVKDLLRELQNLYKENKDIFEEELQELADVDFETFCEYQIEAFEDDDDFDNFEEYIQWAIDNFGAWG